MVKKIAFIGLLVCLLAGLGYRLQAQEKLSDTLYLFNTHADTVRLAFDDTLHISAKGKDDAPYAYRWNINGQEAGEDNVLDFSFMGQRKNQITGIRVTSSPRAYYFDISEISVTHNFFVQNPSDTVYLEAFPEYAHNGDASWIWVVDGDTLSSIGPQIRLTDKEEWDHFILVECYVRMGEGDSLHSGAVISWYHGSSSIYLPENEDGHFHHLYIFNQGSPHIYCHPNDTLCLDAWEPDEFTNNSHTRWYSTTLTEEELNDEYSPSQIVFFRGTRDRDFLGVEKNIWLDDTTEALTFADCFIHWGNAEIESDSIWVFFPQYPYSNLGGRVDLCLPPDAPLPNADDTVHIFNLGPWNRELDYVDYAWFDGTKDISGRDSVVGTDSTFAYLFGRMDSLSPELYAGTLVTRVATDSLWQDSCQCYVPCTDDGCNGYDTVRIYLHRLPSQKQNLFLPQDTMLCAHKDLELQLPPAADDYRCFWLDQDSVLLPYGFDTNQFTITGMRGTDGFGANTDTKNPRFFQLQLDHKLCGISFFDTLLVYDQVRPNLELPCHDTVICLNEPVELDSLNPLVYRLFYSFEWNDGTKGSAYSFTDSGTYILYFFVNEDFAVCGYDTASDTLRVRWSDPEQTLITLSDTSFCEKLSVTLDASVPVPSTRYSWQEGNLDDLFSPIEDSTLFTDPVIKVDKEVSLALFVVDTMGCVNTKQIDVSEDDCKPSLSVPNVFTPNGDGVNDVLKFRQIDQCYDVDVLIVDRKGSRVLHQKLKNPEDFSWNGCMNNGGRKLPDGAYFYQISYKNAYGKKKYQSGSITILGSRE